MDAVATWSVQLLGGRLVCNGALTLPIVTINELIYCARIARLQTAQVVFISSMLKYSRFKDK